MVKFRALADYRPFPSSFCPAGHRTGYQRGGVPWDGGTTNRAGTRHGPRELRNASSLVRRIHPVTRRSPYDYARVGDLGDVRINPVDLQDSTARIEAGITPLIGSR